MPHAVLKSVPLAVAVAFVLTAAPAPRVIADEKVDCRHVQQECSKRCRVARQDCTKKCDRNAPDCRKDCNTAMKACRRDCIAEHPQCGRSGDSDRGRKDGTGRGRN